MFMDASDFDDLDGPLEHKPATATSHRPNAMSGGSAGLTNGGYSRPSADMLNGTASRTAKRAPNMAPPPGAPPVGVSPRASAGYSRGDSIDATAGNGASSSSRGANLGLGIDVLAAASALGDVNLTPGSQSRARVLAQQRELQLRRRQQAAAGGDGAVRLNVASVSLAHGAAAADAAAAAAAAATAHTATGGGQFTPAVKQFSSPRVVEKDPYNFDPGSAGRSEFAAKRAPVLDGDSDSSEGVSPRNNNVRRAGGGGGIGADVRNGATRDDRHRRRVSRDRSHSGSEEENRGKGDDRRDHRNGGSSGGGQRGGSGGERRQYERRRAGNGSGRGEPQDVDDEWELAGGGNRIRTIAHSPEPRQDDFSGGANAPSRQNGDGPKQHRADRLEKEKDAERARKQQQQQQQASPKKRESSSGDEEENVERKGRVQGLKNVDTCPPPAAAVAAAPGGLSPSAGSAALVTSAPTVPGVSLQAPPSPPQQALDVSDMKRALTTPCPVKAGVVQCYIRRNKVGSNKLFPEYHVYMRDGDRFLMCCKKRAKNRTSNYLISMRAGDLDRESPSYLGKLRANFVGTEFTIFDAGANPRDLMSTIGGQKAQRRELGCVVYASNVLGSRGPRKMQVAIPALRHDGAPEAWQPDGRDREVEMLARLKQHDHSRLFYAINKPPRWNDQVGAYVLNFNGRVTMASVKNFQLVSPDDQESIVLQFGRVAKDEFTMDFQHPMSPLQAFAITLSSFDSKIACD